MPALLDELLAVAAASCAGAEALGRVASAGAGASAIGGAGGVGEAWVTGGVGAVDSRFAGGAGRFGGSRLASFFAGSRDFGVAGSGRGSASAGGAVGSFAASASVAAEPPLAPVAAVLAWDVAGVAFAATSLAALSDDMERSSTNAPPITVTVITVNPIPNWLLTRSSCPFMRWRLERQERHVVAPAAMESDGAYNPVSGLAYSASTPHLECHQPGADSLRFQDRREGV